MFSKPQNANSIKFYGVDSAILSSTHARAVMVKKMHENDVHDIFPVLYEVASILPQFLQPRALLKSLSTPFPASWHF